MCDARTFLRSLPSASCSSRAGARTGATVTILHFNDVYEITPVEAGKAGGLARLARFRAELKTQHPDLITTLGGDYVSPSALGTARVNGERLAGKQMVAVLNVARRRLGHFRQPRVRHSRSRAPRAARRSEVPHGRLERDGRERRALPQYRGQRVVPVKTRSGLVRVGLIGLTVDVNKQAWVRYAPPIDAARAAVAGLKGKCDVIVALTHLTLAGDQQLAEQVPEIDLILGGHEHENWVFERGPNFTPIVKADANARTAAIVTVALPREGEGRAAGHHGADAADRRSDEGRAAHRGGSEEVGRPGLPGFPRRRLRTHAGRRDDRRAARRPRVLGQEPLDQPDGSDLDAMRHEAGTTTPIFNGGSIRIDDMLPPGPVTQYDVIRVVPFGGKIVKATFTGALLSRVLAIGASNIGTGGFLHSGAGAHRSRGPLHARDQRFPAHRRRGQPRVPDPPESRDQQHHRPPGHPDGRDRRDEKAFRGQVADARRRVCDLRDHRHRGRGRSTAARGACA